ncbi:MAG: hypothetical protein HY736_17685 [Verrucomicrobia bacterium]|nr:hypothetical protein [Verrucomicrobiota bacterium]
MKTRALLFAAAALVAVVTHAAQPAPRPPLLAAGAEAPEFTALRPDNTPVKLSDFRGKVAFSGVGSGPQTEAALEKALAAAGFKL